MVLPCFKAPACAVVQLFPTIGATHNAGEHICLACPRRAAFVLALFLHPFPCISVNYRFVGVLKHKPFFLWIIAGLFALVRLLVGLEVYRMPLIFWTLQNVGYGIACPVVKIIRRRVPCCPACLLKMDCRRDDLFLFQNTGDLRRPVTVQTQGKYRLTTAAAPSSTIQCFLSSGSF